MKFPLKYKAALLILTIVLMTSVVATFVSSKIIKNIGQESYTRQAVHLADTIAVSIDGDQVRELRDAVLAVYNTTSEKVYSDRWGEPEFDFYLARYSAIEGMDAYTSLREYLRRIQDVNDAESIYVTWLDVDAKTILYLVDAAEEDACLPGVCDQFFYEDDEILQNPERGFLPTVSDSEEYGWLVATSKAIHDSTGELVGFACVDVSMNEIVAEQRSFVQKIAFTLLCITVVAGGMGIFLVDWFLVRPINILSDAAERYTSGEEGERLQKIAELSIHTKDEVEALAHSLAHMEHDINEHIAKLLATTQALVSTQAEVEQANRLAGIDALTKVRNKRSYDQHAESLNESIRAGSARFCLTMIDLNDLKKMNDTYGHEKGDISINTLCRLICKTFKHSPVFRIGGDEFVVIQEGEDYNNADTLIADLTANLQELNDNDTLPPWERINAAIGCARYDPAKDTDIETVFERADAAMYACKRMMKENCKSG